jgi:hypothetical protein
LYISIYLAKDVKEMVVCAVAIISLKAEVIAAATDISILLLKIGT